MVWCNSLLSFQLSAVGVHVCLCLCLGSIWKSRFRGPWPFGNVIIAAAAVAQNPEAVLVMRHSRDVCCLWVGSGFGSGSASGLDLGSGSGWLRLTLKCSWAWPMTAFSSSSYSYQQLALSLATVAHFRFVSHLMWQCHSACCTCCCCCCRLSIC